MHIVHVAVVMLAFVQQLDTDYGPSRTPCPRTCCCVAPGFSLNVQGLSAEVVRYVEVPLMQFNESLVDIPVELQKQVSTCQRHLLGQKAERSSIER